jgi:RHH-type proline utilization regulon transcriptional repressor/proline dehydrogenase/delta 1-pyrroline-5-carboxylate dehydrogenase
MIVDSSALAEQVVGDVIASAFDSAGQRCSALRVLCLQEEIADRTLAMLKGALAELSVGRTDRLDVDIGPVITVEAKRGIETHIEKMRSLNRKVEQLTPGPDADHGTFVPPTIIELDSLSELTHEVFGPVLHIIRYRREQLDRLIDDINATGYGLTFGLHTRLDETIAHVTSRIEAGNLYINRNVIGAVVGVQPFGGRGLSGTGPKAGGPLYLRRLVSAAPAPSTLGATHADEASLDFAAWLESKGEIAAAGQARRYRQDSALGMVRELRGPVGECNLYAFHARGRILLKPLTPKGLYQQISAALATGNMAIVDAGPALAGLLKDLPSSLAARVSRAVAGPYAGALIEGDAAQVTAVLKAIAELPGSIPLPQSASAEECAGEANAYDTAWLIEEVSTSINTTAAGGNASLMAIA